MPLVQSTSRKTPGDTSVTITTLNGTDDSINYTKTLDQVLFVANSSGGDITINLIGADATTYTPDGYGDSLDLTGGFPVVVANGETVKVYLPSVDKWLQGAVAISNGSGLTAWIIEG